MGTGLSYINTNEPINLIILFLSISTTILLQILSNLANDYGDGISGADNNRQGPVRMIQSGYISKRHMLIAIIISSIFAFTSGLSLIYFVFGFNQIYLILLFISIGMFAIWAAIKYTMGKSPYGYNSLGDLFVFIFFGLVGVIGSYYLQTLSFHWISIIGALFTGSASMAVLNMNNMRDYYSDRNCNKNTLVVKLGLTKAKYYHILLICISSFSLLILIVYFNNIWLYICLLPLIFLVSNIIKVISYKDVIELDSELKKIALCTFATTLLFMIMVNYV
jgi:1,4-dihydroxy-2-naphthoate octaprenyltransferase